MDSYPAEAKKHDSRQKHTSIGGRIHSLLASVRTGIVLLIVVGLASAVGTLVLQRPLTDPEALRRAYSPETLRWLDALGLTDVFHSWWFVGLLALLSVNIVLASVERLPLAWRYFSRPYRRPEAHFLSGLPLHKEIAITSAESGLRGAEEAFRRMKLKPQRVAGDAASLFAEKNRISRLAAYVVHASLLLILGGGITDALWGYRGFLLLTKGQQSNQMELRQGVSKALPFTIRCDAAGREDYPDGSPRRWWSQLAVVENGREMKSKQIEVNEPLVYRGLRFYQSSYGSTGELSALRLRATSKSNPAESREIVLRLGEAAQLDSQTSVQLAAFYPDFMLQGDQIVNRSNELNNPAIHLVLQAKKAGGASPPGARAAAGIGEQVTRVWLFPRFPSFAPPDSSPYRFAVSDLEMGYFTGLQVSYEPGQWAVWFGVILMGIGLAMAFYFVHMRFWAVPVGDDRGRLSLWVGASASKNRDEFAERFERLVEEIEKSLKQSAAERGVVPKGRRSSRQAEHKAVSVVGT